MKHITKIIAMPLGLLIGLGLALFTPFDAIRRVNPTVAVIVTLCAVVAVLAWRKGR